MAVGGTMAARAEVKGSLTADRRLYLSGDGRVVEADDPARATLLVAQGAVLGPDQVAQYGLREKGGRIVVAAETTDAPKAEAPAASADTSDAEEAATPKPNRTARR